MANLSKIVKISWSNYQILKSGGTVSGQTYDANAIYLIEDNGALDIGDGSNLTADMKAYLMENPATPILYNGNFYLPQTNINDDDYVYYYYHAGDAAITYCIAIDWGGLAIDEDFSFHFLTKYLPQARIWYGDSNNIPTTLPIGSAGQVLKVVNGLPAWANEYSYTLPLATSGARGGIKIGYSATGANIPLQLSSEKAYVALTSSAIVSALGYTPADAQEVENYYLPLAGGVMTGGITLSNGVPLNAKHTNGTAYNLLYVNSSNAIIFGSPYFGGIYSQDSIYPLSTNTYNLGTNSYQWNNIHGKTIHENGTSLVDKYVAISGKTMTGFLGTYQNHMKYYSWVNGGFANYSGTQTGKIFITLPENVPYGMIKFKVGIYNYVAGTSCEFEIAGYTYTDGSWYNVTVNSYGKGNISARKVTFYYALNNKYVIAIGDLNSTWEYPQIMLKDIQIGFDGSSRDWTAGWSISISSTEVENTIHSSYSNNGFLPLSGGTLTGVLNFKENQNAINFRPSDSNFPVNVAYETDGNEALVFKTKYVNTSFIFATGITSTTSRNEWQGITTPGLQIKENCVSIGTLIANGANPIYRLNVNGTSNATTLYENGTLLSDKYVSKTISLASNIDLNTVMSSGFYRINTGYTNGPDTSSRFNYGQLIVSRGSDTFVQIIYRYADAEHYIRTGVVNNTSGEVTQSSGWKQIAFTSAIPATNVIPATTTANKLLVSTTTSGTAKWSDWSSAGFLKTNSSGVISVDTNSYALSSHTHSDLQEQINNRIPYNDVLMPTNPFGGRQLYINSIDNAFASADRKFYVTVTEHKISDSGITYPYVDTTKAVTDDDYYVDGPIVRTITDTIHNIFDGSYETSIGTSTSDGSTYLKVRIMFGSNTSPSASNAFFPGYPYGNYYLSYYYNNSPDKNSQVRVYNKYSSQGLGWHLYTSSWFSGSAGHSGAIQLLSDSVDYSRTCVDFIIYGNTTSSRTVELTQIDYKLSRPNLSNDGSTVTKYGIQNLYWDFIWNNNHSQTAKISRTGEIIGSTIYEGGSALSSKYLGISSLAIGLKTNTPSRTSSDINTIHSGFNLYIIDNANKAISPSNNDGLLAEWSWPGSTSYGVQFFVDDNIDDSIYFRQEYAAGTWRSWIHMASREWVNNQSFATEQYVDDAIAAAITTALNSSY